MKIAAVFALLLAGVSAHAQCVVYPVAGAGRISVVPCGGFVRGAMQAPITIPAFKPFNWGTTPAQITGGFAYNFLILMETNTTANINAAIAAAGSIGMARLSTELAALDTATYTHWILAYAVIRGVSVPNLKILHAAFGDGAMAGVLSYMSPAVLAAYNSPPAVTPLPYSYMYLVRGGTVMPPYDLTQRYLYDLYLLQLFSGNDTPTVAMHKTVLYAQVRIHLGLLDVLVGAAAAAAIIEFADSPTATKMADWYYFYSINPYRPIPNVDPVIVVPDLTLNQPNWPPLPDPLMSDFPAVEGSSGDQPYAFDQED